MAAQAKRLTLHEALYTTWTAIVLKLTWPTHLRLSRCLALAKTSASKGYQTTRLPSITGPRELLAQSDGCLLQVMPVRKLVSCL